MNNAMILCMLQLHNVKHTLSSTSGPLYCRLSGLFKHGHEVKLSGFLCTTFNTFTFSVSFILCSVWVLFISLIDTNTDCWLVQWLTICSFANAAWAQSLASAYEMIFSHQVRQSTFSQYSSFFPRVRPQKCLNLCQWEIYFITMIILSTSFMGL